ncbi:MAG: lipoyl(octanoyl) transferase LipB [Halioglobus sp.]
MKGAALVSHRKGLVDYAPTLDAMRAFTDARTEETPDELWLLQHPAVFTQGQSGKAEHVLAPGDIPVLQVDRGGQVTYHGPGQWVLYLLIDLRRRSLGVRDLVTLIETSLVELLAEFGVEAAADPKAPGVYVDGRKIASLGLRVRRGCSYHGLALNVDMDLEPFSRINPCGHAGLQVTSMAAEVAERAVNFDAVGNLLIDVVKNNLHSAD